MKYKTRTWNIRQEHELLYRENPTCDRPFFLDIHASFWNHVGSSRTWMLRKQLLGWRGLSVNVYVYEHLCVELIWILNLTWSADSPWESSSTAKYQAGDRQQKSNLRNLAAGDWREICKPYQFFSQSSALTANSDKISIPRRFANPISCSAEGAHSPQIATKPPSQGDLQTLQLFNQSSALTANSYKISIPRRLANPISCSAKVAPSPQIVTKYPFQGDLQTLSIAQPK